MRFDFDEDQQAIRNDARRFLTERCAMDSVRDYLEGDQAEVSPLWHEMSELGWQGVAIPEAFGGLGMGYLELCVLAEELGRVAAPFPSLQVFASPRRLFCGLDRRRRKTNTSRAWPAVKLSGLRPGRAGRGCQALSVCKLGMGT